MEDPMGARFNRVTRQGRAWVWNSTHGSGHGQPIDPIRWSGMGPKIVDPVKPEPIASLSKKVAYHIQAHARNKTNTCKGASNFQ